MISFVYMAQFADSALNQLLEFAPDMRWVVLHAPPGYLADIGRETYLTDNFDFIQFFAGDKEELEHMFPVLVNHLETAGVVWISWPVNNTDLTQELVKQIGQRNRLSFTRTCSLNSNWYAAKFINNPHV